jgi:hypothetical protein
LAGTPPLGDLVKRKEEMQNRYLSITLIMFLSAFILGACGSAAAKATPTSTPLSVEAISTSAAQTVFFQLTQQAPTITPTAAFTDTPVWTATATKSLPTKAAPPAASCANMTFISDVTVPDGQQMTVNQAFTKTWKVQNTGTCAWTTSFKLVFSYGEAMSGKAVTLAGPVATGDKVNISVDLTAPNKAGKLTGVWVLVDDKGQPFGPFLTVVINVGTASPSPTGGTLTPTGSTTPKKTKTPTETPTHKPTKTPTATL